MIMNDLENIKNEIESMNKTKQLEVLTILKDNSVNISENKNGCFINLTTLNIEIIDKLKNFIKYSSNQEEHLNNFEKKILDVKSVFFKEVKDNEISSNI